MQIRTLQELAAAVRGRRRALRLSQSSVAKAAGVSRSWLADFEAAKATAEIGNVLSVLDALDFTIDVIAPDEAPRPTTPTRNHESIDLDELMEAYDRGDP